MSDEGYTLLVAASAERGLRRLPERVAAAVVEFMVGALVEHPKRVGHPLRHELHGLWSARRGPYRIVYQINEDERRVEVLRIEHRTDVYRPR